MGFRNWLRGRAERDTVSVNDVGVARQASDGHVESVEWSDLLEVGVMTTADGPLSEDVFILLIGSGDSGCVIPQGSDGADALVDRLLKLPGFDEQLFIKAMGSTSNRKFVCWKRDGA